MIKPFEESLAVAEAEWVKRMELSLGFLMTPFLKRIWQTISVSIKGLQYMHTKQTFTETDLQAAELCYVIGFSYKLGLKFITFQNMEELVDHWLVTKTCEILEIELIKHTVSTYGYTVLNKKLSFDASQYATAYLKYMRAANDNIPLVFLTHTVSVINTDVIARLKYDGLNVIEGQGGIGIQLQEKVIYNETS